MMSRELNVLIFEHTTSHSELLFSQIKFLQKANHKIHLWINSQIEATDFENSSIYLIDKGQSGFSISLSLLRYLKSEKIDVIIFNTAHGIFIRNLCLLLLFTNVKAFGVLHRADKIINSLTQKIISLMIKHYFVLNDFVLNWIKRRYEGEKIKISSFYPIFFPEKYFIKTENHKSVIICIPGAIEPERKDYDFLIEFLKKHETEIKDGIKFKLLGNISNSNGKSLLKKLIDNKIENWFITFDSMLPNPIFFQELNNSDFILPLIHPSGKHFNAFYETGISGAFSLALAAKKPLLLHNQFSANLDFQNISSFYNEDNFILVLKKILEDDDIKKTLVDGYETLPKLNLTFQAGRFNEFLLSD